MAGRSIVIHGPPNNARIACANILPVGQQGSSSGSAVNVTVAVIVAVGIVLVAGLVIYYLRSKRNYRRAQSAMQL